MGEMVIFFGKLVGTAVRHNMTLGLDMGSIFWRALTRLPISRVHLDSVDTLAVRHLQRVEEAGMRIEGGGGSAGNDDFGDREQGQQTGPINVNSNIYDNNDSIPVEWQDVFFSTYLADGTKVNLIPKGDKTP